MLLLSCVYYWDTYERREMDEQKRITQPQKNTDFITNDDPSIEQEEVRCCSFRGGNPFQVKDRLLSRRRYNQVLLGIRTHSVTSRLQLE
ncbi:hypothetical protein TNCV_955781 [Trichonephila clavipes]|nr:hypothetical protein TNCV_955781 [Trichonephila clavipes]